MMGMAMMQQMMNQNNMMQNQQNQQGQQSAPPPPPMIQYFVSVNGQQQGPFKTEVLQQMIANGQLKKETFVWKQGMAGWKAAGEVPEVSGLFGATPPPPPPPPM